MGLNQYASVDREAIWAALFAWFKSQLGSSFVVYSRKHTAPPQLVESNQPAFFQVAVREKHIPQEQRFSGMPSKLLLRGYLILYVFDPSPTEDVGAETQLAETTINILLKAIDNALVPDNVTTGKFTIGGLVTHCWIEGDTDTDPGIFGPQCAAILPIFILV